MMVRTLPLLKAVSTSRFFPGTVAVIALCFLIQSRIGEATLFSVLLVHGGYLLILAVAWKVSPEGVRLKISGREVVLETYHRTMADIAVPGRVPLAVVALALSELDRLAKATDPMAVGQFGPAITILLLVASLQTVFAALASTPLTRFVKILSGGRS